VKRASQLTFQTTLAKAVLNLRKGRLLPFFLLSILLLSSCSSSPASGATSSVFRVQYTAATTSWLFDLNACANQQGATTQPELRVANMLEVGSAELVIRIGEPEGFSSPAYQIGSEEIVVIVNRLNPIGQLPANTVRGLFSGQIQNWKAVNGNDAPVQVWTFPAGEDVEQAFVAAALNGGPATPAARIAITPDEMAQAVANDVNAIGILSRHWKMGNVSDVFTVTSVPVLAIFPTEPQGGAASLLACLQK
jgi:hypothetical protein